MFLSEAMGRMQMPSAPFRHNELLYCLHPISGVIKEGILSGTHQFFIQVFV